MDRILATHTGSLIRPPELLAFLAAKERGQDYDEEAYQKCLRESVDDVVRRQVEAGIDVVDDGEMGKASWITYLYERVSGLEVRPIQLEGASMLPPSRDRQAFPGAYAALDALDEAGVRESTPPPPARCPTRRPRRQARAWPGCAPARSPTTGPRSTATSPTSRRRWPSTSTNCGVPAGGRAGERLLAPERVLRQRGGVRVRAGRRAPRGVQGRSSTPGYCSRSTTR